MNKQKHKKCMSNEELYIELKNSLNPRNGTFQEYVDEPENRKVIDISWKGDFHFIVYYRNWFGFYCVKRDNQQISPSYKFGRVDLKMLANMQKVIDEIDTGKYRNKKTHKEKIRDIVTKKQLTSCMNDTKWRELSASLREEIGDVEILYKTLFDKEVSKYYWFLNDDEYFDYMSMAEIEWLKIACIKIDQEYVGRLVDPLETREDRSEKIKDILERYNIYHEYDKEDKAFIVYGYR